MCRLLLCIFLYVCCDINFLYILCLFLSWRVEEPVTEDPGAQQIEVAEQELIEGKLCPFPYLLPNNVLCYHLFMHRFNFNGTQWVTLVCLSILPCYP
jgi:hypothetical protein